MNAASDAALDQVFGALSDRHRRAILRRLSEGPATVNQLAAPFDISLQAVSRHLKVLEAAGLISRSRKAQWHICALAPEPLRDVDGWIAGYRKFWSDTFDRMEDYLEELEHGDE